MSGLFEQMRARQGGGEYGWSGQAPQSNGERRFYARPVPITPGQQPQQPQAKPPAGRTDDMDRPNAYPVVVQGPTQPHYVRPTLKDILIDLGLRMIEVSIAAAAQEVAWYFMKRRFIPKER